MNSPDDEMKSHKPDHWHHNSFLSNAFVLNWLGPVLSLAGFAGATIQISDWISCNQRLNKNPGLLMRAHARSSAASFCVAIVPKYSAMRVISSAEGLRANVDR